MRATTVIGLGQEDQTARVGRLRRGSLLIERYFTGSWSVTVLDDPVVTSQQDAATSLSRRAVRWSVSQRDQAEAPAEESNRKSSAAGTVTDRPEP